MFKEGGSKMNFLEKLDKLLKSKNINKHILAKESGIPYTTIDAFYKKGYSNIKLSTITKLCSYFDVSIDYMMKDDIEDIDQTIASEFKNIDTTSEKYLINNFRKLNQSGQVKVIEYAEDLINNF